MCQQAALPPHMDSSVAVAQVVVVSTPPNTCFLGPIRVTISDEVSIGSAIFAQFTAERPYTLAVWLPFPPPQNCRFSWGDLDPYVMHDSLGLSRPTTQKASSSIELFFAQLTTEWPFTLQWVAPFPSKFLLPVGDLDPWFLWLTQVLNPNGISISSGVFGGSH